MLSQRILTNYRKISTKILRKMGISPVFKVLYMDRAFFWMPYLDTTFTGGIYGSRLFFGFSCWESYYSVNKQGETRLIWKKTGVS
jgi:hypothetical protein